MAMKLSEASEILDDDDTLSNQQNWLRGEEWEGREEEGKVA